MPPASLGDIFPKPTLEFVPLMLTDTSGWPQERKLSEEEHLDANRVVDSDTVEEGYWWAFHFMDESAGIVMIKPDEFGEKIVVYRSRWWRGTRLD
jgi:hypothetical protein